MTSVEYLWRGWQKVDWMYRNYWELLASDKSGGDSRYIMNICHPDPDTLITTHGSSGAILGSFVERIIQHYTKGWMFELPSERADVTREMGWGLRTTRRNCWNPAKCHRLNTGQYVIKNTVSTSSSRRGIGIYLQKVSVHLSELDLLSVACVWVVVLAGICHWWPLIQCHVPHTRYTPHPPRVITVRRAHYFLMWPTQMLNMQSCGGLPQI